MPDLSQSSSSRRAARSGNEWMSKSMVITSDEYRGHSQHQKNRSTFPSRRFDTREEEYYTLESMRALAPDGRGPPSPQQRRETEHTGVPLVFSKGGRVMKEPVSNHGRVDAGSSGHLSHRTNSSSPGLTYSGSMTPATTMYRLSESSAFKPAPAHGRASELHRSRKFSASANVAQVIAQATALRGPMLPKPSKIPDAGLDQWRRSVAKDMHTHACTNASSGPLTLQKQLQSNSYRREHERTQSLSVPRQEPPSPTNRLSTHAPAPKITSSRTIPPLDFRAPLPSKVVSIKAARRPSNQTRERPSTPVARLPQAKPRVSPIQTRPRTSSISYPQRTASAPPVKNQPLHAASTKPLPPLPPPSSGVPNGAIADTFHSLCVPKPKKVVYKDYEYDFADEFVSVYSEDEDDTSSRRSCGLKGTNGYGEPLDRSTLDARRKYREWYLQNYELDQEVLDRRAVSPSEY